MAQQINLFSPLYLRQKKYFSAATMMQALGLVALGGLVLYGYAVFETRSLERLSEQAEARSRAGREQLIKLGADLGPQSRSKLLADEAARLEYQLKQREALVTILLSNAGAESANFSPYLTALARQATQGVWLTGVAISGGAGSLTLKGRALDADRIPVYIRTLNREPVIKGRQVSELVLSAKEGAASPGAQAPSKAMEPARYVEFTMSLSAPQGGTDRKAAKGSS